MAVYQQLKKERWAEGGGGMGRAQPTLAHNEERCMRRDTDARPKTGCMVRSQYQHFIPVELEILWCSRHTVVSTNWLQQSQPYRRCTIPAVVWYWWYALAEVWY